MGKRRQERLSVEIKRILSQIISEQIKDPGIDLAAISITRVDLSNDLSHARINISVYGDDNKIDESLQALNRARGYIRSELARSVQLKHAPEIEFRLDRSIEHGIKISTLLDELKKDSRGEGNE